MRVELDSGPITGTQSDGAMRFLGIPFAAPAVGARRFMRPQPTERRRDVLHANVAAPAPLQAKAAGVGMRGAARVAENCLFLNVFAPVRTGNARPVLAWIYGGGYLHGDGADALFDGGRLAATEDVVVVTFNYRLGVWGFAPLEARNVGLADQIAALDWIRRNVALFGGDPGNVTVAGESAGAMSVCNLLASPVARGLFHRAIAQSGAATHVATSAQADETARVVREELRVDPADADTDQLLAAQRATIERLRGVHRANPFRPHYGDDLLPEHPMTAAAAGSDVPLIIGINRDEYRLYIRSSLKLDDAALGAHLERRLGEFAVADVDAAVARLLRHYRERLRPSRNPNAALLADIETELRFRDPMLRYALARGVNTYLYQFDWESPALRGWLGATHALEIPFVFGNFDVPAIAKFTGAGTAATVLSRQIMALWTQFMRDGRAPEPWRPFSRSERFQLQLGRDVVCRHIDDDPTVRLWDEVLHR
jgi:para-nitrobenzyl esterase